MEDYYRSGRMLMNLALAVGRLVLAGRELTRLAGYTARVTELQTVLKVGSFFFKLYFELIINFVLFY